MPSIKRALWIRDDNLPIGWVNEDGTAVPWWYSRDGIIVKWVFFLSLIAFFLGWVVIGHLHARRRIKKGLPPLAYHSCLISKRSWAGAEAPYAMSDPAYGPYQSSGYPTYNGPPPPVYDPKRPPIYEEDGSKIDPSQNRTTRRPETDPAPEYEAPPGPPPAARR